MRNYLLVVRNIVFLLVGVVISTSVWAECTLPKVPFVTLDEAITKRFTPPGDVLLPPISRPVERRNVLSDLFKSRVRQAIQNLLALRRGETKVLSQEFLIEVNMTSAWVIDSSYRLMIGAITDTLHAASANGKVEDYYERQFEETRNPIWWTWDLYQGILEELMDGLELRVYKGEIELEWPILAVSSPEDIRVMLSDAVINTYRNQGVLNPGKAASALSMGVLPIQSKKPLWNSHIESCVNEMRRNTKDWAKIATCLQTSLHKVTAIYHATVDLWNVNTCTRHWVNRLILTFNFLEALHRGAESAYKPMAVY